MKRRFLITAAASVAIALASLAGCATNSTSEAQAAEAPGSTQEADELQELVALQNLRDDDTALSCTHPGRERHALSTFLTDVRTGRELGQRFDDESPEAISSRSFSPRGSPRIAFATQPAPVLIHSFSPTIAGSGRLFSGFGSLMSQAASGEVQPGSS